MEQKDRLLRPDEIPNELVSDLFPMDNSDKVAELFNRWGRNKQDIIREQDVKTTSKIYEWGSQICNAHYDKILKRGGQVRRCCYKCWQSLL